MCKVINMSAKSNNAVYIGRPGKWGNPFVIGKHGDRRQVVEKYAAWVTQQEHLMRALHELKGKDLRCYCAPQLCHGDVLAALVAKHCS